jgi:hypothetical protein
MKFIRIIYYNDVTGKTTYYLNVENVSKLEFSYCEDREYVLIKFDDANIEGVCPDFDEIHFEIFLTDPESNLFNIEIINHKLYVHTKGNLKEK